MNDLGRMAHVYASVGWPVLPLNGKVPLTENGVDDATTAAAAIKGWWQRWPSANIGLACGRGLMVLDVDGPEGQETFERLFWEHELPETRWIRSGRDGGVHLYFEGEGRGCQLGPQLELRGEGSYVVAPPSLHKETGRRYKTVVDVDPAPKPNWLRKPEPPPKPPSPPVEDETTVKRLRAAADAAAEGELQKLGEHSTDLGTERGTALYAAACALGRHVASGGLPRSYAEAKLREAGDRLRLDEEERDRSIERGLEKGAEEPYGLTERDFLPLSSPPPTDPAGDPRKGERSPASESADTEKKGEESACSPYLAGSRVKPRPLGEAAYHGLAGRIVRLIEPHSEAAPEALLAQLLAAAGNALGRHVPACMAEDDRHLGRLFEVLVGPTSNARKGTSWGRVKRVMRGADLKWVEERVRHGGLSSGEGLIQALRGPVPHDLEDLIRAIGGGDDEEVERLRSEDEVLRDMADAIRDWDGEDGAEGLFRAISEAQAEAKRVADKEAAERSRPSRELRDGRLLLVEAEFSRVLRVCKREHSTTAAIVRSLWDGDEANVLTRNRPLVVRGAHLSIIAHITQEELRRELTEMELMNGFANRFLFFYVERVRSLPFGGQVPEQALYPLLDALADVISHEWGQETTAFDDGARGLWKARYDDLVEGRPGLHGAATARAAPQVLRLALIYALLDKAHLIRIEHLEAALEVWRYCDESAAYLFGGRLGDRVAEFVLGELEESDTGHLDRSAIYKALSGHVTKAEINAALDHLEGLGLIWREPIKTGGRPKERIHQVPKGQRQ